MVAPVKSVAVAVIPTINWGGLGPPTGIRMAPEATPFTKVAVPVATGVDSRPAPSAGVSITPSPL